MYDIVIIGAGPAGSNLARLLSKKKKVLLVDRRNFVSCTPTNEKLCGGLLAPDAQLMFAKLNLSLPNSILVNPQIFAVKTIDLNNNIERYYQRFYLNFDRFKFDKWMFDMIPDDIDKMVNTVFISCRKEAQSIIVKLRTQDKEMEVETKVLVGADGSNSSVRKSAYGAHKWPKQYLSIQEVYKSNTILPYYLAIFDQDITDFYSWIIPKEDTILIGSALDKADANEKFELLKLKLSKEGLDFSNLISRKGTFINRAKHNAEINYGRDNILLIGESAGLISPSSAEGISYALYSSTVLANCISNSQNSNVAKIYNRKMFKMNLNMALKHVKSPFMFNTNLRKIAMKSSLLSIKVL